MTAARMLDDTHRTVLLSLAADAIGAALSSGRVPQLDEREIDDPVLRQPGAAFVTLLRDDGLLGCVGSLVAVEPLAAAVHRSALQAAFADPRLPSVTVDDFEVMTIKASVLSPLAPLPAGSYQELVEAVRPGVDGLVVEAAGHRATLLPSVWEQCGDVATFLAALWEKAGLASGEWPRSTRVQRYTTDEFASPGPRALVMP